jgi:hypothetical protein
VQLFREEQDKHLELHSVDSKQTITPRTTMMNQDIYTNRSKNTVKSEERSKVKINKNRI